ncbi:hypothetical protein DPMN_030388 [Dreissena polymorpha]|uniref:Uncharacterized protein n=1 Tax=Dreissena polymorpha TaxID=45954 RepID=A0A9D4LY28_DREPO|nr:hypothetical protein DPMN_030388 [Dreissena polymorpha]
MYRSYTGTLSAFTRLPVALPGSVWAPVELWCRTGAVPVVHSATPVVCSPGCPRSSTVHPGRAPVHPGMAPVHPGRCLITRRGSAGIRLRPDLKRIVTQGGLGMFKPIYQALNNNLRYPMPAFLQSNSPYPYNAHSALGYGAIKPFGIQSLFGGAYPGYLAPPPLYQPYDPHQQVVTKSVIYSTLLNEILRRLT